MADEIATDDAAVAAAQAALDAAEAARAAAVAAGEGGPVEPTNATEAAPVANAPVASPLADNVDAEKADRPEGTTVISAETQARYLNDRDAVS